MDNVRYVSVEVRDKVPLLLIDNLAGAKGNKEADSYYLAKLFTGPVKGLDVQIKTPADLDTLNLTPFVGVILCDVPKLTEAARKNLEDFAAAGGGLAFFVGPNCKGVETTKMYNEQLYRKGEGPFPAPIDPKHAGEGVSDDDRMSQKIHRLFSPYKQIVVKDAARDHPALERIYKEGKGQKSSNIDEYEKFFNFVVIDRYWVVNQNAWKDNKGGAETLVYLANRKPVDDYKKAVLALLARLPMDVPAYAGIKSISDEKREQYCKMLVAYRDEITREVESSAKGKLERLAELFDALLKDGGDEKIKRPNLKELWQLTDFEPLRKDIESLRDQVKYGDPLYVAKPYGKGRVAAFLCSAGGSWNDLEGFGKAYYPPLMVELQRYLAGAGTDANMTLGKTYALSFDPEAYDTKVKKSALKQDEKKGSVVLTPNGDQVLQTAKDSKMLSFEFADAREPGVYLFKFVEKRKDPAKPDEPPTPRPEYRAVPYNVDALAEGDLRRADTDDLKAIAGDKAAIHYGSDETYASSLIKRKGDWSESPWFYLAFMLVLVFEQFMAVRLSFHLKPGSEAGGEVPSSKFPVPS